MMGLGYEREAVILEALDQPHLPQRLRAVQLLREDARGQAAQLLPAPGRGQRGVANVVLEVEVGIVHPHRPAAVERRGGQLVAIARHEMQPPADLLQQLAHRRRRALDDDQAADVHVGVGSLLVQKGCVDRGEPVEVALGH